MPFIVIPAGNPRCPFCLSFPQGIHFCPFVVIPVGNLWSSLLYTCMENAFNPTFQTGCHFDRTQRSRTEQNKSASRPSGHLGVTHKLRHRGKAPIPSNGGRDGSNVSSLDVGGKACGGGSEAALPSRSAGGRGVSRSVFCIAGASTGGVWSRLRNRSRLVCVRWSGEPAAKGSFRHQGA